ncbi:energy-coupling factor transporter transmembrane protein EcfT [Clostridium bovifaecis]|uniref:Energy-coupling factor transporter transmembrane protein EcfT n=1 Tax=Clostridium bovifaecis TaxID=2184719 RepID=A0A6I6EZQ2_9CLOT|nr:energy-coupling factor transporter transmembrane protein EcfT [Clostridium bovifaecis]
MKNIYKEMHTITPIVLNLILIVIALLTKELIILFGVFIFNIIIFKSSENMDKFRSSFVYFIPFFIIAVLINSIFITEGNTVIFTILKKDFTLETIIYSLIFSFKLLLVIHIFINLDIMLDSDRTLSYFSKNMPKTTLVMLIGLKFFPTMKDRLHSLKEIYSIRGVNFEGNKLVDKIKGYIPLFSILLESSLEGAFDIGEAAYIRGFLSGKRSIYDKQNLIKNDYILLVQGTITFLVFIIDKVWNKADVIFGLGSAATSILIILLGISTFMLNFRRER